MPHPSSAKNKRSRLLVHTAACAAALHGDAHVTHAGVIRALLGHWLRRPIGEWSVLKFAFASVTLVKLTACRATLRYANG